HDPAKRAHPTRKLGYFSRSRCTAAYISDKGTLSLLVPSVLAAELLLRAPGLPDGQTRRMSLLLVNGHAA
ncbi:hypothetical protein, partial [Bradyrhizobium liaoningense]|uniref:hypothetical protein n=1 Tax=Bradyrhizobium liaoningense TaxID=43992 RepID=UPI001AEC610F